MAKTIYIAGLGLIGTSMALGIKRDHPDYEILGYNRSQTSRAIALERGMVDCVTDDFASFAPLADVIILCLPIKQTVAFIKDLANMDQVSHCGCGGAVSGWQIFSIYRRSPHGR